MKLLYLIAFACVATSVHAQGVSATGESDPATPARNKTSELPPLPPLPAVGTVENGVQQFLPLSPAEIRQLRKQLTETKRAAAELPGVPPKPTTGAIPVDLTPGAVPPVVRVSYGKGAALSFIDSTGAPWPIASHTNFNDRDFKVSEGMKNGHVLTVTPRVEFGEGNIAVMLDGLPTPVTLTLLLGSQPASDYRADLRLPLAGPNAKPMPVPVSTRPEYIAALTAVLDGVAPANARPVRIMGASAPVFAWISNGMLILKTRMVILSPPLLGREASADGTYAYALNMTPVILASEDGIERQLSVDDSKLLSTLSGKRE